MSAGVSLISREVERAGDLGFQGGAAGAHLSLLNSVI